jgi:hypothetical protein
METLGPEAQAEKATKTAKTINTRAKYLFISKFLLKCNGHGRRISTTNL